LYANCQISNEKIITRKQTNKRCCLTQNMSTITEKHPDYIDFKTINDIMSGRHPSKNLELSPILCVTNMLQLHRLKWNDHLAVLKIFWNVTGDI